MALDMTKFLARFVQEAREHITRLNEGLVKLEQNPDDAETIRSVFRSAHTIKGSSRMMKLAPITEVAHTLEDALAAVRDGKVRHTKELADVMFKGIDLISALVEKTASGQPLEQETGAVVCAELAKAAGVATVEKGRLPADDVPARSISSSATEPAALRVAETIRVDTGKLDALIRLMGEIISTHHRLKHRLVEVKEAQQLAKRNPGYWLPLKTLRRVRYCRQGSSQRARPFPGRSTISRTGCATTQPSRNC